MFRKAYIFGLFYWTKVTIFYIHFFFINNSFFGIRPKRCLAKLGKVPQKVVNKNDQIFSNLPKLFSSCLNFWGGCLNLELFIKKKKSVVIHFLVFGLTIATDKTKILSYNVPEEVMHPVP